MERRERNEGGEGVVAHRDGPEGEGVLKVEI